MGKNLYCFALLLGVAARLSAQENVSPSENVKYAEFSGYFMLQTAGKPVAYLADHAIERVDRDAESAVIFIHDPLPGTINLVRFLIQLFRENKTVKKRYFIMPAFFTERTCPEALREKVALWSGAPGHLWRSGGKPFNGPGPASFEVASMIFGHFSDPTRYPNLKHVSLAVFTRRSRLSVQNVLPGKVLSMKEIESVFSDSE